MSAHELAEIEIGEQVSVHHEEVVVEPSCELAQRSRSPERFALANVVDRQPELGTVAEIALEQVREMPRQDGRVLHTVATELPEQDLEDRHLPDRDQRLRKDCGERAQPRPTAAG